MTDPSATALAHPNIALIKYWGDLVPDLHIPANGSISMNLGELTTRTSVSFDDGLPEDVLFLNGVSAQGEALERVSRFLDRVRALANLSSCARVVSANYFPIAAGLASSAAGFAALSLAASRAASLQLDESDLSRLARRGSGSACRSVPGGFVEWQAGHDDLDSYAFSIAPAGHWDLVDCIALVSQSEKTTGSIIGHTLAQTSPIQEARLADTARRLDLCRRAIHECNFSSLASVVELDSNLMHSVMLTSTPPLIYWQPATLAVIQAVQKWRAEGLPACYSIDAGPNVHVLCEAGSENELSARLLHLAGVEQVLITHPGGPAELEKVA